jgi:hypothetical protein
MPDGGLVTVFLWGVSYHRPNKSERLIRSPSGKPPQNSVLDGHYQAPPPKI